MSVYALGNAGTSAAGVLVLPFLSDSGQVNFSESFKADLIAFNLDDGFTKTLAWNITYTLSCKMFVDDWTSVSALEGYPDRYRFGQLSFLFGNQAYSPFFIDRIEWQAPGKYPAWYVVDSYPFITFYETAPTELATFDAVVTFASGQYGLQNTFSFDSPATQIAWDIVKNVGMTININYHANRLDFANDPDPAPTVFWQWV